MAGRALLGKVREFSPERETFSAYVERIEMFFTANGIIEAAGEDHEVTNELVKDRQRAIFLTEVEPEVYSTISNLVAPKKLKEIPLTELIKFLEKHYNPHPLEIAESFHFGTRNQKQVSGQSSERSIYGLNNVKIQNKLLNTEDLTFDRACQIAKSMQMAEKNSQEFLPAVAMGESERGTVNQLKTEKVSAKEHSSNKSCFRCGAEHNYNSCKFKNAKCFKCSKIGHIPTGCRDKSEENKANSVSSKGSIHNMQSNDEYDKLGIFSVETSVSKNDKYKVSMSINGCMCKIEVDTTADGSIMSKSTYTQKFSSFSLAPSNAILKTYTGEPVNVCGEMRCDVGYKGQIYLLPLLVADYTGKPTLLGRDWLTRVKLDWEKIFQIRSPEPHGNTNQLNNLISKHKVLFEESYKDLQGLEAHITIKKVAKPVFFKPRKIGKLFGVTPAELIDKRKLRTRLGLGLYMVEEAEVMVPESHEQPKQEIQENPHKNSELSQISDS
ncbi:hypothetical protein AWC38_SpisGene12555 [Stylophora pistillata]|uniref:CCHC-type domain-containing protein n=1 Tax=Stylophora pistillata TaxID=50429 RepID=A0A2B4S2W1_STYPI|nr:hypothetical protein AWC38_SpisGene12555 [Stylophora pistillata]